MKVQSVCALLIRGHQLAWLYIWLFQQSMSIPVIPELKNGFSLSMAYWDGLCVFKEIHFNMPNIMRKSVHKFKNYSLLIEGTQNLLGSLYVTLNSISCR